MKHLDDTYTVFAVCVYVWGGLLSSKINRYKIKRKHRYAD